jgi:hypothetical protein
MKKTTRGKGVKNFGIWDDIVYGRPLMCLSTAVHCCNKINKVTTTIKKCPFIIMNDNKNLKKTLRDYLYFFIFAWLTIVSVLICWLSIVYLAYIRRKCLFWRLAKSKGGLISKSIINLIVKTMSLIFLIFNLNWRVEKKLWFRRFFWRCDQIENTFRDLARMRQKKCLCKKVIKFGYVHLLKAINKRQAP